MNRSYNCPGEIPQLNRCPNAPASAPFVKPTTADARCDSAYDTLKRSEASPYQTSRRPVFQRIPRIRHSLFLGHNSTRGGARRTSHNGMGMECKPLIPDDRNVGDRTSGEKYPMSAPCNAL